MGVVWRKDVPATHGIGNMEESPARCPAKPWKRVSSQQNGVKRKPVILYSPRGDFKSIVKMHGGKIKIYLCRQSS